MCAWFALSLCFSVQNSLYSAHVVFRSPISTHSSSQAAIGPELIHARLIQSQRHRTKPLPNHVINNRPFCSSNPQNRIRKACDIYNRNGLVTYYFFWNNKFYLKLNCNLCLVSKHFLPKITLVKMYYYI